MADRMNDDREKNMGRAGQHDDKNIGQQTPARNPQQGQHTGQKDAGQKNNPIEEDDEFNQGQGGKSGQGAHSGRPGGQNE